ncbi:hypothetical protein TPHA_0D02770 [Tetrapisispora phaffii CBS 4417]|uniref:Uncharacterized protein n=1 Tax=Tetrapisispora phaffii (strain ATCC 24235 / CBS 4417 / NBRC 1672 / NRRL Y-8282 / UCD 70-5) TaxID=1071381 RepID=G8BSU2_TETPH|nr:hypothetical protein TPHA_0D02770 [Tetrapisispora phaffii CBS 4417]CCE62913.1 hypothetical protein TPHA_0D02770 [Tetrapisispora phaffii CBS 4417]
MSNTSESVEPTDLKNTSEIPIPILTTSESVNGTVPNLENRLKDESLNNINLTETIGGSETRKYLNQNVTQQLLNGMKIIAKEKPKDPLRVLGEYLIEQSDLMKKP